MNITVSVCCITFNHQESIESCLEGIIRQETNFPVEVLIFDDASSDATQNIIKEYAKRANNFKLFLQDKNQWSQKKYGLVDWLFPNAQGEFIALIEGDDVWCDNLKLQKQVDFMRNNTTYSGCYHNSFLQFAESPKEKKLFREHLEPYYSAEDTFSKLALFHTSSFLFRKSALQIPDFLSKIVSGDMALFSIVSAAGPLGRLDDVMSIYRKNAKGLSSDIQVILNYHRDRITLMNYLNAFHNFTYDKKAQAIISYHQKIIELESRPKKIVWLDRMKAWKLKLLHKIGWKR